jgi:thioredoxin 1
VLVDVWAPWCGPCRALHPILDELARDMAGELVIAKLNSDENQRTAFRFNVIAIPTMLLFKCGELVAQMAGVAPKRAIREWIEKNAA